MKTLLIIAILAVCLRCSADTYQIGPMPSSVPIADTTSAQKARDLHWQTEQWTGSDQPFQQTQTQIESSLKQGASLSALLDQAEAKAVQKPYDATAQFAWCYLAYKAVHAVKYPRGDDPNCARLRQRLSNSTQGMIFGTQPHSYVYSRLLFLARLSCLGNYSDFATIGQRLLDRNSQDDEVRSYMIDVYADSNPPQIQYALNSLRYLLNKPATNAHKAYLYDRMGNIYLGEFSRHKRKDDADNAIDSWHKAIRLDPRRYDPRLAKSNMSYIHKIASTKEYQELNN